MSLFDDALDKRFTEAPEIAAINVTLTDTLLIHDSATGTVMRMPVSILYSALGSAFASLIDGKVPASQLPSYVDDVLEYANFAAFPGTGETGKIYIAIDTNKTYRWSGSIYVEISASPGSTDSVTEGLTNLYFTNARALAAAPAETVTTIGGLINGATSKTTPIDADAVALSDSAASGILKKLSWSNIKATLKAYFDTLYPSNETGNWTPVYSTTGGSFTMQSNVGTYVKIGNYVIAFFTMYTSAATVGSGDVAISGLPFNCVSGAQLGVGALNDIRFFTTAPFSAQGIAGTNKFKLFKRSSITGDSTPLVASDLSTAAVANVLVGAFFYQV